MRIVEINQTAGQTARENKMNVEQQLKNWAEQAKSLFPADSVLGDGTPRYQAIDEKLNKTLDNIANCPAIEKTCVAVFLQDMNTHARIAYRRKYQSEIVEIK